MLTGSRDLSGDFTGSLAAHSTSLQLEFPPKQQLPQGFPPADWCIAAVPMGYLRLLLLNDLLGVGHNYKPFAFHSRVIIEYVLNQSALWGTRGDGGRVGKLEGGGSRPGEKIPGQAVSGRT